MLLLRMAKGLTSLLSFLLLVGAAILLLRLLRPKTRKGRVAVTILAMVLCIVLALSFPLPPIENLLYTFPTPEAVMEYLYPKAEMDILVEGEHSVLFYCHDKEEEHIYIAPRVEGGYHLAGRPRLAEHFWTDTTPWQGIAQDGNIYDITIHSVPDCPDRYVGVFGSLMDSPDVTIISSGEERFVSRITTNPIQAVNGTVFSYLFATAPLKCDEDGLCHITIRNGQQYFTIDFDPEVDLFTK